MYRIQSLQPDTLNSPRKKKRSRRIVVKQPAPRTSVAQNNDDDLGDLDYEPEAASNKQQDDSSHEMSPADGTEDFEEENTVDKAELVGSICLATQ